MDSPRAGLDATHPAPVGDADGRPMAARYAAVVIVEIVVIAALWIFSRYFSH